MVAFSGVGMILGVLVQLIFGVSVHSAAALLAGIVPFIKGILMLRNTAFFVTPLEVQIKNLSGTTVRRYPLASLNDLEFDGPRLNLLRADGMRKTIAKRFRHHPGDWERLKQKVFRVEAF